ncbi:BQ2448_1766 [Microbotryum intermedium]|uniref:BQ2448_1766 protein n=1 Tax=Microbotryum intermedium TaxID=269621 RepID=A0A238F920_9BASI|nr:BQ2448_1766 [Microbotryum intermedium]
MLGFSIARLTSFLPVPSPSCLVAVALRLERSWIGITQEKTETRPRPMSPTLTAATQAFFAVPHAVVRSPRSSSTKPLGSKQQARQYHDQASSPRDAPSSRTHQTCSSHCIHTLRSAQFGMVTTTAASYPLFTPRLTPATLPVASIPTRSPFSDVFETPIAFETENESLFSASSPSYNLFPRSSTPIKSKSTPSFVSFATSEPELVDSNDPIFVNLQALRRRRPLRFYDPARSDSSFSLRRELVARMLAEKELSARQTNGHVFSAEGVVEMDAYDGACFEHSVSHFKSWDEMMDEDDSAYFDTLPVFI